MRYAKPICWRRSHNMSSFSFNSLLLQEGLSLTEVRLLRHETQKHGRTPYSLWRDDPDAFENYQRIQARSSKAWFRGNFWASFVVSPDNKTLFVGLYEVAIEGAVPQNWVDPLAGRAVSFEKYDLYSTQKSNMLAEYAGRVVIDWGLGTRSWRQLAANQEKPIIELREKFIEPVFPGYAAFLAQLSEINSLPSAWRGALTAARGVYLLTCPRTKEQYIGSASGSEGFLGRWNQYLTDGHGGNIALRIREPSDYRISILQVAGSADDRDAILAMETTWKNKLQSREMGLNRN